MTLEILIFIFQVFIWKQDQTNFNRNYLGSIPHKFALNNIDTIQSKCLEKVTFETDSFGNGNESYPGSLLFIVQNDSLQIKNKFICYVER